MKRTDHDKIAITLEEARKLGNNVFFERYAPVLADTLSAMADTMIGDPDETRRVIEIHVISDQAEYDEEPEL